jgi:nitrogen fixation protein FixH
MFSPLPLTSTTAQALWSGLVLHDAFVACQEFKNALLARASFGIEVHTSDDASSNDRFQVHFLSTFDAFERSDEVP